MIEFYNEYHLGDNVFHLTFLRKLCALVDDNFVYYVHSMYLPELNKHIVGFEDRITLKGLEERTPTAINAWIGEIYDKRTYEHKFLYDNFYVEWFNILTNKIYSKSFNITLHSDYPLFSKKLDGYEILFINSVPMSGQFNYTDLLDDVVRILSKKYHLISTRKVEGVECTLDKGMSLVDIGTLAANCRDIVGINGGPMSACINQWAIQNVKSWIIADSRHSFSFNNVTHVNNFNELVIAIQNKYK